MENNHDDPASPLRLKMQLKHYVAYNGLTASELARKCRIAKQVISDWLAGAHPRNLEQLKRVADELGTSIDHLCFGDGVGELSPQKVPTGRISGRFEFVLDEPIGPTVHVTGRLVNPDGR